MLCFGRRFSLVVATLALSALLTLFSTAVVDATPTLEQTQTSPRTQSLSLQESLGGHRHTSTCVDIHDHPDTCAFVQTACHGFAGAFLQFYYCTPLWKPIAVATLCGLLLFMFGAVSVVASDFFCPNLQTISSKLQLSESMAGVTILAFGNGSPDLFSTFSAMDTGSGSLAVGELIGAAFFIVAIVSGSMGIIRPFQSKRITFMRDATFLTGAVIMITWIVYHQRIYWYHGVTLVTYYLVYVCVVVLGSLNFQDTKCSRSDQKSVAEELFDETSRLLGASGRQVKPPRLSIPAQGFMGHGRSPSDYEPHLGHIIRPLSARSSSRMSMRTEPHDMPPRSTSTLFSISSRAQRRAFTPRVGIRTSLFGAIEFQEQLNALRRATSSHGIHNSPRQRQISMPHWKRQSSQTSVPCMRTAGGVGRPRASTMTDQMLAARSSQAATSPDSTNSSTGLAEDYFTYLSANQPAPRPLQLAHTKVQVPSAQPTPVQPTSAQPPSGQYATAHTDHTEFMIPEIRLAPPNHGTEAVDDGLSHYHSPVSPMPWSHSRGNSTSHNLLPWSPSFATEDEVFVSARQSPEISPSPSMQDHRALTTLMPHTDMHPQSHQHHHQQLLHHQLQQHQYQQQQQQLQLQPHQLQQQQQQQQHWPYEPPSPFKEFFDSVIQTLFPTLRDWHDKTALSKINALAAIPLVFIFTLTLPVAEPDSIKVDGIEIVCDDDDDGLLEVNMTLPSKTYLSVQGMEYDEQQQQQLLMDADQVETEVQQPWCRWLLTLQAVFSTVFLSVVMAVNGYIDPMYIGYGFAVGCLLAAIVYLSTNSDKPPSWFWMLSFAGFFVALNWIFLLANEMVGLLKALGMIFNISEAIMGLTVFAMGSSIGDLVANTAIAKMGFPTMAISACYAGPLLNSVLGVGISTIYQTLKTGVPYELDIAPTILVSSAGLIIVLLSTLIVVNLNGFCINERLGFWMIFVYVTCCVINVTLEYMSTSQ